MKLFRYAVVLAAIAYAQVAMGDTLSLVGGNSGNFALGWMGEAWKSSGWCGDTLAHDATPDTIIGAPDTIRGFFVSGPINDTITTVTSTSMVDSLAIGTTTINKQTILRDSINAPVVDIVYNTTTIIDSNIIVACNSTDFVTDTGVPAQGTTYFNYTYKFRNYWAQLPFVWQGWGGYDSATVSPYKTLLITYKGLLPTHQAKLGFFYASWGSNRDTAANTLGHGDGLGILAASPTEWKTVIIQIPDSVQLANITGITLAIENVPNGGGGQTSDAGSLKVAQISLIAPDSSSARRMASSRNVRQDRFHFIPKTAGQIRVSVYSLNGALLGVNTLNVNPSKSYSIRQVAQVQGFLAPGQVRVVKIQGAGLNLKEKIW